MKQTSFNNEAEKGVLGAILFDNASILHAQEFLKDGSEFHKPRHAEIYRAFSSLYEANKPIDLITVQDYMADRFEESGGLDYLVELMEFMPASANIKVHAQSVKECHTRRELARNLFLIREDVLSNNKDLLSIQQRIFDTATAETIELGKEIKAGDVGEDIRERLTGRWEAVEKGLVASGISSGIKRYDELMGGLWRKEVMIVGARPRMGKSWMAVHMALEAEIKGARVCFMSLEMDKSRIIERMVCNVMNMNYNYVRSGRFGFETNKGEYQNLLDRGISEINKRNIWVYDNHGNIDQILAAMQTIQKKHDIDIFFIDYLQRIPSGSGEGSLGRHLQIGNSLIRIGNMAKKTNTAMVVLAQVSRKADESARRPMLQDLKDSGSIEQEADTIMFLHRDYEQDDNGRQKTSLEKKILWEVAKSRDGDCYGGYVEFIPERSRIEQ